MYILDTHTFLWFLRDSKDLSSTAKEIICSQKDINILPILGKDLDVIQTLENIHGDPFDRIIISQGVSNSAIIITKDSVIPKYPVRTLW